MKSLYFKALTLLTALCTGTVSCFAAPNLTARIDGTGQAYVQVVTDAKDPDYLIYILEPGAEMNGLVQDSEKKLNGLYMLEEFSGEPVRINKEYDRYSLYFTPDETVMGTYTVVVVGKDLKAEDKEAVANFTLPDPLDSTTALTAVTATPTESTLREYQGNVWYVDFDDATYKAHPVEVLESFAAICKNPANGGDVQVAFELACNLIELRYAAPEKVYDLLYRNEGELGLTYCPQILSENAGFLTSFIDLRADSELNPIRTTRELGDLLYRAEALSQVNEATRENFINILTKYEDVFGLSATISGVDAYDLTKEVILIDGARYTTVKQVVDAVKEATEELSVPQTTSRPQSSGGGTGGGRGGIALSGVGYTCSVSNETMNEISPSEDGDGGFIDLGDAKWAEGYINYLNYAEVMSGDGSGYFRPNENITREEFAKTLVTALKINNIHTVKTDDPNFADIDPEAWYYETVRTAYQCGVINGMDESTFGIGRLITRQDAATMVNRAREVMELAYKTQGNTITFTDQDEISQYAKQAIINVQRAGIINGYDDGSFKPNNPITRAETAKLIYALLESLSLL